jgi:hypothetical protein
MYASAPSTGSGRSRHAPQASTTALKPHSPVSARKGTSRPIAVRGT